MIHVTCRLTAKNRDQLRNPALGNRVWATFTFLGLLAMLTNMPPASDINVTLPAFASERRAAARAVALLLPGARRCRSTSLARRAHSNKPTCGARWDRQTNERAPYRYTDPAAYYARSINNLRQQYQYSANAIRYTHYYT